MSHSICFPPRKVTAKVYVTKMASQKKVPQITTTNKNNKNTTDLRFQTLSSASLWCARILFVNERENAARLLLCCVATFGNLELNLWASIPLFFVSERSPKGRKVCFKKKYLHGVINCPLKNGGHSTRKCLDEKPHCCLTTTTTREQHGVGRKKNQRRVNAFLSSRSLKSRPRGVSSRRCVEFS